VVFDESVTGYTTILFETVEGLLYGARSTGGSRSYGPHFSLLIG